jgi:hypothetical protein
MSTGCDVDGFLYGVLAPSDHDHDVIALALNESFSELGGAAPVPYVTVRTSATGIRHRRNRIIE